MKFKYQMSKFGFWISFELWVLNFGFTELWIYLQSYQGFNRNARMTVQ